MGNAYLLLGNKFEREKDATASRRLYNKSIYCYKNAIDIYPLNYDAWVKKAKLENELNLSKDAELSSLQAIRINPNYGHQAWVLWTDIDTHQSELTEENSNNSLNNLKSLDSKTNSVYQFEPCCILPSNMSI
jgi:tetratricopeptide (TPR) repeat protein